MIFVRTSQNFLFIVYAEEPRITLLLVPFQLWKIAKFCLHEMGVYIIIYDIW